MSLGTLNTEADLKRRIERWFPSLGGVAPAVIVLPEVENDPDAPTAGALLYCIADDGAGKRAVRARFATGAVQTVATEP